MNRAFLSLYFFIVISVVLIGWGLDKFWESLAPQENLSAEVSDLITLLDNRLNDLPREQQAAWLAQVQQNLRHQLDLIDVDDLVNTSVSEEILAGEIVRVGAGEAGIRWYKRIGSSQKLLVLTAPVSPNHHSTIYSGLLVVFYLGIALVIFLWVWPLSRDLGKLEKQTRHVGKDGVTEPLAIAPSSTVYPLANAFNKMSQRIRELISSHREMTYAVSHELRTPLARMKFALAMTEASNRQEPISPEQSPEQLKAPLDSIRQDIHEMEELISSLLLYAGFEQSSGTLDQRDGHIKDLLDDILARRNRDRPSDLVVEIIDDSNGAVFTCEWKLMETAIQNLLQNATRFARSRIRVQLAVTDTEFQLAVEDDGPGIPAADRERVFDSFVRLYNDDATQIGGFGLGLAIVRRVIHWHRGSVTFQESEWGGAKALLCWPRKVH